MHTRLAEVFLTCSLTPHSNTGISHSELLLGCRPRLRLDVLKPHTAERVERNQRKQKEQHLRSRERNFEVGNDVLSEIITMETNGCQTLSSNTEHSTFSTTSDTTSTEPNMNADSTSFHPVSIDTDAAVVNPTPNMYPKRSCARFEPTWTSVLLF